MELPRLPEQARGPKPGYIDGYLESDEVILDGGPVHSKRLNKEWVAPRRPPGGGLPFVDWAATTKCLYFLQPWGVLRLPWTEVTVVDFGVKRSVLGKKGRRFEVAIGSRPDFGPISFWLASMASENLLTVAAHYGALHRQG